MMKNTVVFGSGQIGIKLARLLAGDYHVICFADNSLSRQKSTVNGIPVVSPEESLKRNPECYCIGVLDSERALEMERQLRDLNYDGEIIHPKELLIFDPRVATMRLFSEKMNRNMIPGDVAELGVYMGDFAKHINGAFRNRELHLYDTFEGFYEADLKIEKNEGLSKAKTGDFSGVNEKDVLEKMPYREKVFIHKGHFPETFKEGKKKFCFVSLDADLYLPTKTGLETFWPCISKGGIIMVHDYESLQYKGARKAADEFLGRVRNAVAFPVCDLHGSLVVMKV